MMTENTVKQKMTDEQATPLDWFMLEMFSKMLLGEKHQLSQPSLITENKKPAAVTTGDIKSF